VTEEQRHCRLPFNISLADPVTGRLPTFSVTLLMAGVLLLATGVPAAAYARSADQRLKDLYTAEYRWRQKQLSPSEDDPKDEKWRLPDVGPAAQALKLQRWTRVSRQLADIRLGDLSRSSRTDFAVYQGQIDALLAEQRFREFEKPLNSDSSFWGDVAESARGSFRSEDDFRKYIAMLRAVPRYFDQQIDNMRAGLLRGFTPPQVTLQGRDIGVAQIAECTSAVDSPFYVPFHNLPASMSEGVQRELRREAESAIREAVIPAHIKLLTFLRSEYIPGARKGIAAYDLPNGQAYYRSKIREFVTTDESPENIHAIGLAAVADIRGRMREVMSKVGFVGEFAEFLQFLRSDPQFYAKSPQELLNRAAWIAKSFDGKAPQWFGRLPRSRFAIKPVPEELAPFYTGGRGGPGIYMVNTYNLPARPLYSIVALTLHESAPGHAFQMPLAAENMNIPQFRRDNYLSAYGEGWAVYSEALGEEMGMYETPYELFGMLSYQMWRAARLVVDIGIHTQGWTREQAQNYLRDNTALANHEIETEVDRYIAWPAQALSYYMGERTIQEARSRAQRALGSKFNIRAFHDVVLALGSVPLTVIDAEVDKFISNGGKGPYPDEE
jgi:uncharacterized protein (DUF885 family)